MKSCSTKDDLTRGTLGLNFTLVVTQWHCQLEPYNEDGIIMSGQDKLPKCQSIQPVGNKHAKLKERHTERFGSCQA